jgi:hypothetical protein
MIKNHAAGKYIDVRIADLPQPNTWLYLSFSAAKLLVSNAVSRITLPGLA